MKFFYIKEAYKQYKIPIFFVDAQKIDDTSIFYGFNSKFLYSSTCF